MRAKSIILNMVKVIFPLYLFTLLPLAASAQKYEPNTRWPYLYQNFTKGVVFFEGNQKSSQMDLNIHLMGNVLHYIGQDGKIYKNDDQKVTRVEIGDDAYIFSDHKLVKILANGELKTKVDVEANAFSKKAEEALKALGGNATII